MARKFLYIFAGLIVLVLVGAVVFRVWGERLLRTAVIPSVPFAAPPPRSAAAYGNARLWYARGNADAFVLPAVAPRLPSRPSTRQAAIFFVQPTSYIDRRGWNAPEGDRTADDLGRRLLNAEASIFTGLGPIWAPRYRQATFGAFLTDRPEGERAIAAAYGDVAAAFDAFVAANPRGSIILAGHSQGARHLMRLMAEKVANKPLAKRIAAAYLVGWPISTTADLPALGLPACDARHASGCVLGWQSYARPAEPDLLYFDVSRGLTGAPRKGTPMLCTNPLGNGPNTGMLKADEIGTRLSLIRPGVGARCGGRGFLYLDGAPDLGPFVLPGNNYHVYDFALFWSNVRTDARRRLDLFLTR